MNRWYPSTISAGTLEQTRLTAADHVNRAPIARQLDTLFFGIDRSVLRIAEFGIWQGATSIQFAKFLDNKGELHLFDFSDNIEVVEAALYDAGYRNVRCWGSTYKHLDSYNWSLRKILQSERDVRFDYVYLDGAHTWAVDALTFLLCDMMLNVGGYVEFDDYDWRLLGSSLDPARVPIIAEQYTEEQVADAQVAAIVDLIVRRKPNYREISKNRLFQKMAP